VNKEQKTAAVKEVATQISESEAVFAVDYRGISVPQAAELRQRLTDAGARFRVVKNTLTERAADQAGADDLKALLEGPTAFTFVPTEGDPALAAKAIATFRREHDVLEFKGGRMGGVTLTVEEIQALARLPAHEVLNAQVVGLIASPITGLVRGLNQLIAGLASQLRQIADQGLVGGGEEEAPEEASQEAEEAAPSTEDRQEEEAAGEAEESAGEEEGTEPSTEAEPSTEGGQETETSDEAPSEGDEQKEG
jgi:large subunit ribosomal protein L10